MIVLFQVSLWSTKVLLNLRVFQLQYRRSPDAVESALSGHVTQVHRTPWLYPHQLQYYSHRADLPCRLVGWVDCGFCLQTTVWMVHSTRIHPNVSIFCRCLNAHIRYVTIFISWISFYLGSKAIPARTMLGVNSLLGKHNLVRVTFI